MTVLGTLGAVVLTALLWPGLVLAHGGSATNAQLDKMADLADGRDGLVVWQSRRTGRFRIWARSLDGSNLRQLTPDVNNMDHIAPLISPDGRYVAYYETYNLTDRYYSDHTGRMMLVDAKATKGRTAQGQTARQLVAEVRTYFECRFARWINKDTIAYIGKDHHTYEYSISAKKSTKLFSFDWIQPGKTNVAYGAIPNQAKTHAIHGYNVVFRINNPGPNGTVTELEDFDGCEGNMSSDNKYAYRVEGTTHHFVRMRLSDMQEQRILDNHDSSLPDQQDYIYYPQIDLSRKLLSFGASYTAGLTKQEYHDHYNADYDIFLLPIDSVTLKKASASTKAVKYSFHKTLDSYPDVWIGARPTPPPPEDPDTTDPDTTDPDTTDPDTTDPDTTDPDTTDPDTTDPDTTDPAVPATLSIVAGTRTMEPGQDLTVRSVLKDASGAKVSEIISWSVSGGGTISPDKTDSKVSESLATFSSDGTPGLVVISARAGDVEGLLAVAVGQGFDAQINCGDNAHDASGWLRDDAFVNGGKDYVIRGAVETSSVSAAAPSAVYQSLRHSTPHSYDIPMPDGQYQLRLHFADPYSDRSMNYQIEGQLLLENFDVSSQSGGSRRAWVEQLQVTIADGNGLQIEANGEGDVFEAGLEIIAANPLAQHADPATSSADPQQDPTASDPPTSESPAATSDPAPTPGLGADSDDPASDDLAPLMGGCHLDPRSPGTAPTWLWLLAALALGLVRRRR